MGVKLGHEILKIGLSH